MTPLKSALVVGGTGLVGRALTDRLLASDAYAHVTLLVRRPAPLTHPKLTQRLFDFDQPDPAAVRADDVFCCLGTTIKVAGSEAAFYQVDCTYPYVVAQLARQAGANQFLIVTSLGANARSGSFYLRVKGEVEEKIGTLHYPTLVLLRPSLLLGARASNRPVERVGKAVMGALAPLMVGGLRRYRPVPVQRVAAAMLTAATQGLTGQHIIESETI